MASMFNGCANMHDCQLAGLDMSSNSNMYRFFYGCEALTAVDVSMLDTASVTNMRGVFEGCNNITALDLSKWNTSSVSLMNYMFNGCTKLEALNMSNFDTANVQDFNYMFSGCEALTSFDFAFLNCANASDMSYMFADCHNLRDVDASAINTLVATDTSYMFYNCERLVSLDLSPMNVSRVQNMTGMFQGCTRMTELVITDWSLYPTADSVNMTDMFKGDGALANIYVNGDGAHWNQSYIGASTGMFDGCTSLNNGGVPFDPAHTDKEYAYAGGYLNGTDIIVTFYYTNYDATPLVPSYVGTKQGTEIDLPRPAQYGYRFEGWFTRNGMNDTNGDGVTDAADWGEQVGNEYSRYTPTESISLYAKFIDFNFPIKFVTNGGSAVSSANYAIEGATISGSAKDLSVVAVTKREGYDFDGWYLKDGTADGDWGERQTQLPDRVPTGEANYLTYYAKWVTESLHSGTWGNTWWNIDNTGELTVWAQDDAGNKGGTATLPAYAYDAAASDAQIAEALQNETTGIPWYQYRSEVTGFRVLPGSTINLAADGTLGHFFYGFDNLQTAYMGGLDTSTANAASMAYLFGNDAKLRLVEFPEGWSTAKATSMAGMFSGAASLTSVDLSTFDTSNVTDASHMFANCAKLDNLVMPQTMRLTRATSFEGCSRTAARWPTSTFRWSPCRHS